MSRAYGVPHKVPPRRGVAPLAQRLAQARLDADLTQRAAGERSGLPAYTIAYIEGCEHDRRISFMQVAKLADAYGLDLDDLRP